MKYRRLTIDELQSFEKEFIIFLSANGIDGQDWERKKNKNDVLVDQMMDDFSDFILEQIITKVDYFEFRSPQLAVFYEVKETKVQAFIIQSVSAKNADLSIDDQLFNLLQSTPESLKINMANRPLDSKEKRNQFVFGELNKGCLITKGETFNMLKTILPSD